LLFLAVLILTLEMFRYRDARDCVLLAILLAPIGLAGSRNIFRLT